MVTWQKSMQGAHRRGSAGNPGLLSEVFADQGYRFAVVTNGGEMRKALATSEVDVAVIDVVLPGLEDGLALAKEVAAQGIGVILVTGSHDHFATVEKSGHRYLFRPFRIRSLLSLADELLRESKVRCRTRNRRYGT
jgi:two-component system OmpR family response regulator